MTTYVITSNTNSANNKVEKFLSKRTIMYAKKDYLDSISDTNQGAVYVVEDLATRNRNLLNAMKDVSVSEVVIETDNDFESTELGTFYKSPTVVEYFMEDNVAFPHILAYNEDEKIPFYKNKGLWFSVVMFSVFVLWPLFYWFVYVQ